MTKAGTKTTMKRQPVTKTKMERVYDDVQKFTSDKKLADKLIEKYGVEAAYVIVRQCMQEPGYVLQRVNAKNTGWKTSDAIKYFANNKLSDATVAKGINKTEEFVKKSRGAKNNTTQATASRKTVSAKVKVTPVKRKTSTTIQRPANVCPQDKTRNVSRVNIQKPATPAKPKTEDEFVAEEMARLKKKGATLGTLRSEGYGRQLNASVITTDDFRHLTAGADGKALGKAVKDVGYCGPAECGQGVRRGLTNFMKTKGIQMPETSGRFYQKYTNGSLAGQTLYKAFENPSPAGEYFTVLTYDNNAQNRKGLANVPEGTTAFYEGNPNTVFKGKKGAHPGHTETFHNGRWPNGAVHNGATAKERAAGNNYGAHFRMAIPNDTKVDDKLLEKIIRAQYRETQRANNKSRGQQRSGGR